MTRGALSEYCGQGRIWRRTFFGALFATSVLALGCAPASYAAAPNHAYVIGDSVLLGARDALRAEGFAVDAVEGRRPTRLAGALRKVTSDAAALVIHLGSNGPVPESFCEAFTSDEDKQHLVVLVTITAERPWTNRNNRLLRQCARNLGASRAAVVPWHVLAQTEPELLAPDRVHLTGRGADVLVDQICSALRRLPLARQRLGKVSSVCASSEAQGDVTTAYALRTAANVEK